LSFLVGMLVPLACAQRIKEAPNPVHNQCFMALVLFELFFFVPLGAFLYFFYPDWSLMFFLDPAELSLAARTGIGLAALAGYMLAAMGGFVLAAVLVRKDRERAGLLIMAGVGLLLVVFSAFTIRQLTQVGTFAQWNALPRTTTALYLHRLGYIIAGAASPAGLVLVLTLRSLGRPGAN
jgi:hypothetical protein